MQNAHAAFIFDLSPLIGATYPLYVKANASKSAANPRRYRKDGQVRRAFYIVMLSVSETSHAILHFVQNDKLQGRTKFPSTHNNSVAYSLKHAIPINLFFLVMLSDSETSRQILRFSQNDINR